MNKFLFILTAAAVLTGCAKVSAETEQPADRQDEIKLSSQAVTGVATRVPFEGAVGEQNRLFALVPASATEDNYTNPYGSEHKCMDFGAQGMSPVGFVNSSGGAAPEYYPTDGSPVYLCGLYPHQSWTIDGTAASASLDGQTDLMAAPQVQAVKKGAVQNLVFKHLLTKLNIRIGVDNGSAAGVWGEVTSIKLTGANGGNVQNKMKVTLSDAEAVSETSAADFLHCYQCRATDMSGVGSITYETNVFEKAALPSDPSKSTLVAYVLCPPVQKDAGSVMDTGKYVLTVQTENYQSGGSKDIVVPITLNYTGDAVDASSTAGFAFDVTLTFKATQILATATVTAWMDGGTGTGTIE